MLYDPIQNCYEGLEDNLGNMEHPFLMYKGHYIYVMYSGFDLADLEISCTFNGDVHCIRVTNTLPEDGIDPYNVNLYHVNKGTITQKYIDEFIANH